MRLFYCSKCKKKEIRNDNPYKSKETVINMRGSYGRPIRHYKCECGNSFAGSMDITSWEDDEKSISYCTDTIDWYASILEHGVSEGDSVNAIRGLRRTAPILEQRANGE